MNLAGRKRFASELAKGDVPAFNYLSFTSDHTRGTQPGFPTPSAMVADNDQALGQLVDTISHSRIWSSSAIFVVEDDSQDGADHADAHRVPALVISPFARRGVVIHTRYDLLSVVRSMELILGMKPVSLNDALATPMYDVFAPTAVNAAPVTNIHARINLLIRNQPAAPWARLSSRLPPGRTDSVPQQQLDGHPLEIGLRGEQHAATAGTERRYRPVARGAPARPDTIPLRRRCRSLGRRCRRGWQRPADASVVPKRQAGGSAASVPRAEPTARRRSRHRAGPASPAAVSADPHRRS